MRRAPALIIASAVCACATPDTGARATQRVATFSLADTSKPLSARAGDVVRVSVKSALEDGWHVYSLTQKPGGPTPLTMTVLPSPPFAIAGNVTGPVPDTAFDENFGIATETYDAPGVFVVPIKVDASALPGPHALQVKIRSQACSDKMCLPAKTTTIDVPMTVATR